MRHPAWLKRPIPRAGKKSAVEKFLRQGGLYTVCEEARCPNRGECYARGTATFLILGDRCTRDCRFCSVCHGDPVPVDRAEPEKVAAAAGEMGLAHVVVTSVTRDDLPDGGAGHFAAVVRALKQRVPGPRVEVLVPDFGGIEKSVDMVLASHPDVFNHNTETVPRLYPLVRPAANFDRSLDVLRRAAGRRGRGLVTKSGLMVGLGERDEEVVATMERLRGVECDILTIGQYLRPSPGQAPVARYVSPAQFAVYAERGEALGFKRVVSGPFVRSSYKAAEVLEFGSARPSVPLKTDSVGDE